MDREKDGEDTGPGDGGGEGRNTELQNRKDRLLRGHSWMLPLFHSGPRPSIWGNRKLCVCGDGPVGEGPPSLSPCVSSVLVAWGRTEKRAQARPEDKTGVRTWVERDRG